MAGDSVDIEFEYIFWQATESEKEIHRNAQTTRFQEGFREAVMRPDGAEASTRRFGR